jgi:hypothetical protein
VHVALVAMRILVPGDVVLVADLIHGRSKDLVLVLLVGDASKF